MVGGLRRIGATPEPRPHAFEVNAVVGHVDALNRLRQPAAHQRTVVFG